MLQKAEKWREKHGAQFEKSKYLLVHFTRNKNLETNAEIVMPDITITPTKEARYLGVIFDQELKYKAHLQYIVKKGTKFAMAIANIARATWGAQFTHLRRLFIAVVAPRIDYAAGIWYRPKDHQRAQTTAQTTKLASIQRHAMKAIIGCFRTTATIAMEMETELPPPHIRLQGKILRNLTRIQTLPEKHPLTKWTRRAKHKRTKATTYTSNLEYLYKQYPEYTTDEIEKIYPFIRPPWWNPTIQTHIEPTKEKAKKHHDKITAAQGPETLNIYSDGSGIEGHIGAAIYSPTKCTTRHQYLGLESTHNIFAAELTAINMAITLVNENTEQYTNAIIYVDSQAAITAINKLRRQSGQEIIYEILNKTG